MTVVNDILSHWGPALLVCLTVVLGLFFQNSRLTDLKDRIASLEATVNARMNDLRALFESEIKRLDQRIDRLESPIARR